MALFHKCKRLQLIKLFQQFQVDHFNPLVAEVLRFTTKTVFFSIGPSGCSRYSKWTVMCKDVFYLY